MKSFFAMICSALAMTQAAQAQTTWLSADFSNGIPQGFVLHDNDGRTPSTDMANIGFEVGKAWITTPEGKDGNMVACSTSWYKNAGQADDWMVTTAIEVKSDKAVLRWRARTSDKDYRDGYAVLVSEKGQQSADFDTQASLYQTSKENYNWTSHEVSLAQYAGKTIYIAFVNNSKDKACLYIDDVFAGIPSTVDFTINLSRVINRYGDVTVSGTAFATGATPANGFTIGLRAGDQLIEQHFDNTLNEGEAVEYTLNDKLKIDRDQTLSYDAWIKSGADSTGITSKTSAYLWKQVSEEVTGTWCGYCVRGIVAMKQMNEKYPDSFIGIALHNSSASWKDAMAEGVEDYLATLCSRCAISGYPHSVYNRNAMYSIDPIQLETYYNAIVSNGSNNCGVTLTAQYDEATKTISADTEVRFAVDAEQTDYKLAYVVVENNVHRTAADLGLPEKTMTGYEQNNDYAGGGLGKMGGFEDMPSTVPAEDMWYNDVARTIWPGYDGLQGVIPADVVEGECYSHQCTIDMPANVLEPANTELVVMLIDKNGIIVNADKVSLNAGGTGITSAAMQDNAKSDDAYYTLSGIKINKPGKGLFIHNGKKIVR